jgi:hypothetical protein
MRKAALIVLGLLIIGSFGGLGYLAYRQHTEIDSLRSDLNRVREHAELNDVALARLAQTVRDGNRDVRGQVDELEQTLSDLTGAVIESVGVLRGQIDSIGVNAGLGDVVVTNQQPQGYDLGALVEIKDRLLSP